MRAGGCKWSLWHNLAARDMRQKLLEMLIVLLPSEAKVRPGLKETSSLKLHLKSSRVSAILLDIVRTTTRFWRAGRGQGLQHVQGNQDGPEFLMGPIPAMEARCF